MAFVANGSLLPRRSGVEEDERVEMGELRRGERVQDGRHAPRCDEERADCADQQPR